MWHLLVPPMMTLLDDYQMRWKISGLRVVSDLLDTVPPTLLSRTGLDGLLYKVNFYAPWIRDEYINRMLPSSPSKQPSAT
jgi:hypothetical protein